MIAARNHVSKHYRLVVSFFGSYQCGPQVLGLLDHSQFHKRLMVMVMPNLYRRWDSFGFREIKTASLQISFRIWEVAARELDANAMSRAKIITRYNALHCYPVDLTTPHQLHLVKAITVSQTQHGI